MSRSYKQPWLKDRGYLKNEHNKKFRRVNKILVAMGDEPVKTRQLINQYDVRDWIFYDFKNKKSKRK